VNAADSEKQRDVADWKVLLLLLVVCAGAFGFFLPRLGFYWDDWAKLLVSRLFGLSGYWAYYAEDRPLSGWTHILFTPLLGPSPVTWQVFVLGLRWLTAAGAWWTLRLLWPEHRRQALYAALLFVLYPVFTQQPIAITFHQQWLQYALYFLSTAAMLLAVRGGRPSWLLTLAALTGMALELSVTEYFVGLEALRLVLLGLVTHRGGGILRQRAGRWVRYALPYATLLGGYILWRLFFIQLPGEDPYQAQMLTGLFTQPVATLRALAQMAITDSMYVLLGCWGAVVDLGLQNQSSLLISLTSWALGILTGAVAAVLLLRFWKKDLPGSTPAGRWTLQALGIGALGVLLGCLPGWITNRPVLFDYHSNRYALPAMFGAALMWAAGIDWLIQRRVQKTVLIGGIVALASIFHLNNASDYAGIWKDQLDFYWQLAWRAPAIEPGTAILGENELFPNQGSFSTSAAINLLYPQDAGRQRLAYWVYSLQPRFAIDPSDSPLGIPLRTQFRTLTFEGVTGDSLVIYYDPNRANCLWALGPDDVLNPDIPDLTRRMLPASSLDRISAQAVNGSAPDERVFGAEPAHTWCYFYQKADLAARQGDWAVVARLADEARTNPEYTPKSSFFKTPHEWIPFIEGYAHTGRWRDAQEITIQAANVYQARYREEFCALWLNLLNSTRPDPERDEARDEVWTAIQCKP